MGELRIYARRSATAAFGAIKDFSGAARRSLGQFGMPHYYYHVCWRLLHAEVIALREFAPGALSRQVRL